MSWTGYNEDNTSVKVLLQQTSTWTTISTPLTISDVERLNKQIYSEIRIALKKEDIDLDIADEDELELLSLINDLGTAGLIEKIKYSGVPQNSPASNTPAIPEGSLQKRYENKLKEFVAMKKSQREKTTNFSVFGCHATIKATTPLFERDQAW